MSVIEKYACNGIRWIDLANPSQEEMEQLGREHNLNPHTVKDCLQPEHLPKYEFDEESEVSFLILRFYSNDPEKSASSIQDLTNKIAIFYNEKVVITIHIFATPFLELIGKRLGTRCSATTDLLSRIIWHSLETFDDPAARLSEQVDFYESQVMLKKTNHDVTEALYYIKRKASLSHKVLVLMQEPINHILLRAGAEASLQDVKDQHLKMQTLHGQVLEEVNNLLTLSMSFAAQRTNEVMRILTIFSVFFTPLTFIVGIYGMNFAFMPELRQRWGYPAVLVLMVIVTILIYLWFKRKRWL